MAKAKQVKKSTRKGWFARQAKEAEAQLRELPAWAGGPKHQPQTFKPVKMWAVIDKDTGNIQIVEPFKRSSLLWWQEVVPVLVTRVK